MSVSQSVQLKSVKDRKGTPAFVVDSPTHEHHKGVSVVDLVSPQQSRPKSKSMVNRVYRKHSNSPQSNRHNGMIQAESALISYNNVNQRNNMSFTSMSPDAGVNATDDRMLVTFSPTSPAFGKDDVVIAGSRKKRMIDAHMKQLNGSFDGPRSTSIESTFVNGVSMSNSMENDKLDNEINMLEEKNDYFNNVNGNNNSINGSSLPSAGSTYTDMGSYIKLGRRADLRAGGGHRITNWDMESTMSRDCGNSFNNNNNNSNNNSNNNANRGRNNTKLFEKQIEKEIAAFVSRIYYALTRVGPDFIGKLERKHINNDNKRLGHSKVTESLPLFDNVEDVAASVVIAEWYRKNRDAYQQ